MVNMRGADKSSDVWVTPPFVSSTYVFRDGEPLWINRTLLYAHGYSLEHMTHRLVNGLLPAIDVHRHIKQDDSFPPDFDLILKHEVPGNLNEPLHWNFEEVFLGNPRDFHLLKGRSAVCYPRAVLGLNNTCSFGYCDHVHETELYDLVRELVWDQCQLTVPSLDAQQEAQLRIHVVQRRSTRKILQLERLVQVLEKYGETKIFEFEGMGFCEQARVFYDADMVVAVHGNALGHLLWMRENSVLIELSAYDWFSPFFEGIVKKMKTKPRHHHLRCKSPSCAVKEELEKGGPSFLNSKNRNLVMDDKLLNQLDSYLFNTTKEMSFL